MSDLHEADQVLAALSTACGAAGSQQAWAKENQLSPAYVSDVLTQKRGPSNAILRALGYEKVTLYRKMRAPNRKRA